MHNLNSLWRLTQWAFFVHLLPQGTYKNASSIDFFKCLETAMMHQAVIALVLWKMLCITSYGKKKPFSRTWSEIVNESNDFLRLAWHLTCFFKIILLKFRLHFSSSNLTPNMKFYVCLQWCLQRGHNFWQIHKTFIWQHAICNYSN